MAKNKTKTGRFTFLQFVNFLRTFFMGHMRVYFLCRCSCMCLGVYPLFHNRYFLYEPWRRKNPQTTPQNRPPISSSLHTRIVAAFRLKFGPQLKAILATDQRKNPTPEPHVLKPA